MAKLETPQLPEPKAMPQYMVGAASPLWAYFGTAALGGVAFWWMTRWARPVNLEAMFAKAGSVAEPMLKAAEVVVEAAEVVAEAPIAVAEAIAEPAAAPEPVAEVFPELAAKSDAPVEAEPEPVLEPVLEAAPGPVIETAPEPVLETVAEAEAPAAEPAPKARVRKAAPTATPEEA